MPQGKMKHLQLVAGRIYNLLKKEAAYAPNMQHLEDFRAAQKLEGSLQGLSSAEPVSKFARGANGPCSLELMAKSQVTRPSTLIANRLLNT